MQAIAPLPITSVAHPAPDPLSLKPAPGATSHDQMWITM